MPNHPSQPTTGSLSPPSSYLQQQQQQQLMAGSPGLSNSITIGEGSNVTQNDAAADSHSGVVVEHDIVDSVVAMMMIDNEDDPTTMQGLPNINIPPSGGLSNWDFSTLLLSQQMQVSDATLAQSVGTNQTQGNNNASSNTVDLTSILRQMTGPSANMEAIQTQPNLFSTQSSKSAPQWLHGSTVNPSGPFVGTTTHPGTSLSSWMPLGFPLAPPTQQQQQLNQLNQLSNANQNGQALQFPQQKTPSPMLFPGTITSSPTITSQQLSSSQPTPPGLGAIQAFKLNPPPTMPLINSGPIQPGRPPQPIAIVSHAGTPPPMAIPMFTTIGRPPPAILTKSGTYPGIPATLPANIRPQHAQSTNQHQQLHQQSQTVIKSNGPIPPPEPVNAISKIRPSLLLHIRSQSAHATLSNPAHTLGSPVSSSPILPPEQSEPISQALASALSATSLNSDIPSRTASPTPNNPAAAKASSSQGVEDEQQQKRSRGRPKGSRQKPERSRTHSVESRVVPIAPKKKAPPSSLKNSYEHFRQYSAPVPPTISFPIPTPSQIVMQPQVVVSPPAQAATQSSAQFLDMSNAIGRSQSPLSLPSTPPVTNGEFPEELKIDLEMPMTLSIPTPNLNSATSPSPLFSFQIPSPSTITASKNGEGQVHEQQTLLDPAWIAQNIGPVSSASIDSASFTEFPGFQPSSLPSLTRKDSGDDDVMSGESQSNNGRLSEDNVNYLAASLAAVINSSNFSSHSAPSSPIATKFGPFRSNSIGPNKNTGAGPTPATTPECRAPNKTVVDAVTTLMLEDTNGASKSQASAEPNHPRRKNLHSQRSFTYDGDSKTKKKAPRRPESPAPRGSGSDGKGTGAGEGTAPVVDKRFPCPHCGSVFSRKDACNRHLRLGHCKVLRSQTQTAPQIAPPVVTKQPMQQMQQPQQQQPQQYHQQQEHQQQQQYQQQYNITLDQPSPHSEFSERDTSASLASTPDQYGSEVSPLNSLQSPTVETPTFNTVSGFEAATVALFGELDGNGLHAW